MAQITGETVFEIKRYGEPSESVIVPAAFHIDSPKALNWWLAKIGDLRAVAKRQRELAKAANAYADSLDKQADGLLYGFRREAEPFVRGLLADKAVNPAGLKSLILSGGEIGFRRTTGHVEVPKELEGDVIRWCREHLPEAVKTPPSYLLLTPLGNALKAGEELPPGITWREPEDRLWVS